MIALPYIWRFLQCLRRYHDSKKVCIIVANYCIGLPPPCECAEILFWNSCCHLHCRYVAGTLATFISSNDCCSLRSQRNSGWRLVGGGVLLQEKLVAATDNVVGIDTELLSCCPVLSKALSSTPGISTWIGVFSQGQAFVY